MADASAIASMPSAGGAEAGAAEEETSIKEEHRPAAEADDDQRVDENPQGAEPVPRMRGAQVTIDHLAQEIGISPDLFDCGPQGL